MDKEEEKYLEMKKQWIRPDMKSGTDYMYSNDGKDIYFQSNDGSWGVL